MILKWPRLRCLAVLLLLSLVLTGLSILSRPHLERRPISLKGGPGRVKHSQLVLGKAAGEGLSGRLQCEGVRAVSRGKEKHASCFPEQISFVTFFVPPKNEPSDDTVRVGDSIINKSDRPYVTLSIFLESIQMSNPGSLVTILTDQDSAISTTKLSVNVHVHRMNGNFARNNLMLQRLESYVGYLTHLLQKYENEKQQGPPEHVIFMDADVIVVEDLQCFFNTYREFDFALTFRNNKDQPINSGVIMVRGEIQSLLRARDFLSQVVEVYKNRFSKSARMLGDQLSLAAVIQDHSSNITLRYKKPEIFMLQISGRLVLFLPALRFNWTPSEGAGQFHGMPLDVKVLHFKGSRKRLMTEAWQFLKKHKGDILDMKCLILSSGRAKYDF